MRRNESVIYKTFRAWARVGKYDTQMMINHLRKVRSCDKASSMVLIFERFIKSGLYIDFFPLVFLEEIYYI